MGVDAPKLQFQGKLTPREQDVMHCVLSGLGTRQVSDSMGLSINTVKFHLKNIYAKLGADNRQGAVRAYELRVNPSCSFD